MTKPEILEVVKQMLVDWQNALELKSGKEVIRMTNCDAGFCYYLFRSSIFRNFEFYIIEELEKDIDLSISNKSNFSFWYKTVTVTKKYKQQLQTRIDHLNRTIARLENEIANEKSN